MSKQREIREGNMQFSASDMMLWNEAAHFRAIVESSEDAIVSKTLDGTILS